MGDARVPEGTRAMKSSRKDIDLGQGTVAGRGTSAVKADRFASLAALFTTLAVFSQEVVWNFYDAQVPPALRQYTTSAALIGLLMGIDNLLGLFIQPWMAHRSDQTRTRFGRRMPYLLVGAPVAAAFFCLIPWTTGFVSLTVAMFCFALTANSFKAVTEALVADFQAPSHRGKASALAKVAAALSIVAGSGISYFFIDRSPHLAFAIPACLLVLGIAVVSRGLDESNAHTAPSGEGDAAPVQRLRDLLKDIVIAPDRSRAAMIIAVFAFAGTWSAMRSQLSPYAMEVLGLTRGQAGALALPNGIAFVLAVFPIALLSDRYGRVRMCKLGALVFSTGCLFAFAASGVQATTVGLVIASVGYAAFAVNGIVIMWNLAPDSKCIGAYTGIYLIASASGATLVPGLVGLLIDFTSWRYLMLHTALAGIISLWLISRVRAEAHAISRE